MRDVFLPAAGCRIEGRPRQAGVEHGGDVVGIREPAGSGSEGTSRTGLKARTPCSMPVAQIWENTLRALRAADSRAPPALPNRMTSAWSSAALRASASVARTALSRTRAPTSSRILA